MRQVLLLVFYLLASSLFVTLVDSYSGYEGENCNIPDGHGICRPLRKCAEASKKLKENNVFPIICSFKDWMPIVCCKTHQTTTISTTESTTTRRNTRRRNYRIKSILSTTTTTTRPTPASSKSYQMCLKYEEYAYETIQVPWAFDERPVKRLNCPFSFMNLIVGGQLANEKEFPHIAALCTEDPFGVTTWSCAGSLISDQFILTAAHCTNNKIKQVRLGVTNKIIGGPGQQDFTVIDTIVHNRPNYVSDMALLKLNRKVKFTQYVRPACLYTKSSIPKKTVLAAGWGKTGDFESASDDLLKAPLILLEERLCTKHKQRNLKGFVGDMSSQFCLIPNNGSDSCQGDSGGPLQIYIPENLIKCMYWIVGVVLNGSPSCSSKNSISLNSKVADYVPWIESHVWP